MKMTKESLLKVIGAADDVISALAGTNDEVHKDDTDKMVRLWDDLNDQYAPPEVVRELARLALATMDSEPAAPVAEVVSIYGDPEAFGEREIRPLVGIQQMPYGTKLYRHAQQPVVESEPVAEVLSNRPGNDTSTIDRALPVGTQLYRHAQTAQVVPEEATPDSIEILASARRRDHAVFQWNEDQRNAAADSWNACRAAMLQVGNSPAQSDCCPAQNHVSPEQSGDTPAQSQGWIPLSEQMPPSRHEVLVGRWWGEKPRWCCKWATYIPGHPDVQSSGWLIPGASWTPTHWMPLPAAPQEVR